MIQFFRKIRQQLLVENQLSKYLLYALGEILLVVIGILVALQINNNNERKKIYHKQKESLQLIRQEMTNNLEAIVMMEEKLASILDGVRTIVIQIDAPKRVKEKEFIAAWSSVFSTSTNLAYENGALTDLISSGGLNDIVNDSIRHTLAGWDGKLLKVRNQEEAVNGYLERGNDYIEKNGQFRGMFDAGAHHWLQIEKSPVIKSNLKLLESNEFENIVIFLLASGQYLYSDVYPKFRNEINQLLEMIDRELVKDGDAMR